MGRHHHHLSNPNDNGAGEPLYYHHFSFLSRTRWHKGTSVESSESEIICTSQLLGHNVYRQHAKLVFSYS